MIVTFMGKIRAKVDRHKRFEKFLIRSTIGSTKNPLRKFSTSHISMKACKLYQHLKLVTKVYEF